MAEPQPPLEVVVAGASDIGQVREHNEDHLFVGDLDRGVPVELFDGRGSSSAGSAAGWQRGVIDGRGSSSAGSAAEWQRGVVDGRGSSSAGSAAGWQRGVIDGRGSSSAGSAAEWQRGVIEPWRAELDRGPLLVVCDGMGGVEGGEVASELATRVVWREMQRTNATRDAQVFARLLRRAVRIANHEIHAMARREPGLRGMGTTLSAAGIVRDRLVLATVGDSRAYVMRAGALVQVTHDQSLQSALLAAGHSANEAASAGGAILQALGVGADVEPSLSIVELRRGDRVLLCSDGLHGLVGDPALALLLSEPHSVGESARLLIAAARAAGGSDNITAIVCAVGGERLVPPTNDDDLPAFLEFDPQQEGEPALTPTSYVARRLAARIGLPTASIPPTIPVTGQHAVFRSTTRVPATALPIEPEPDGPARRRLRLDLGRATWWLYAIAAVAAVLIAWWLGGR